MNDKNTHNGNTEGVFIEELINGVRFWRFARAAPRTQAVFTCRQEGMSNPPYDSLNLGFHVDDDAGCVHKNRQLLGRAVGHKASTITSPRQRHGAEVGFLKDELDIGAGSSRHGVNPFDPGDALLTDLQGAPVLLHFADCLPVVLMGESNGKPVVGVIHAGRRSLLAGIVANAVADMFEKGADPGGMIVALGPSIGSCCYEVDEQTAAGFTARFGPGAAAAGRLDLKSAARGELDKAGIAADNVHDLDICTSCNEDFFSYRRDGPKTGRQGAIAWIE